MDNPNGYWMRLARINLCSKKARYEDIPQEVIEKYLGAKGLAAHYICRELGPGINPRSPENKIVLSVGPFQGTPIPSTGRLCTATKSPLTGLFLDTYAGGNFGHTLKRSGFDLVIIESASDNPVYVVVDNGKARVEDADSLWGLRTDETDRRLRQVEGNEAHCVVIGPAGENRVLVSCLISDSRRASGRGGAGAVFGSKMLKAVVARGGMDVPIHDLRRLRRVIREFNAVVKKEKEEGKSFYKHGTSGILESASEKDRLPTRNYQQGEFESASEISGEAIFHKYDVKSVPCCPCLIACPATLEGKWERPEYETLAMLGSNTGNKNIQSVVEANILCNQLGLDTISTGGVLGFAMECSQKGLIDEDIGFGNPDHLRGLILKVAAREGIGDILANGVRFAAMELGEETRRFAIEVKGLEIPAWDPRGKLGHGLAYMTGDIGGSHLRDFYSTKRIPDESALSVVEKIVDGQNFTVERDNYIFCAFAKGKLTSEMRREAFEAVTGRPLHEVDLREISERIWTLIRAFNVREGITREQDTLPRRFLEDPLPSGVAEGCTAFVSSDDLNQVLDKYYALRGWTRRGIPMKRTLKRLGINL